MSHFLQRAHSYSNKATTPESATPYDQALKHESLGAKPIQPLQKLTPTYKKKTTNDRRTQKKNYIQHYIIRKVQLKQNKILCK